MKHVIYPALFSLLILAGCGGGSALPSIEADSPTSAESVSEYRVLASTTILADIVQNVAGNRVKVQSLIAAGVDPHSFQPAPQDLARISEADLLIFNGAGYESFQRILVENSGSRGQVVEAAAGLSSGSEAVDPHFWLDPNNVFVYVENIREGLTHLDPDGAAEFKSNADAYIAELTALDAWITDQVNQIPAEKRLLVTNHEAFGYFAERYGFTVVGTVIESFSTDASPSAQQLATLIDQIEASRAPAIFLDAGDNPALAEQIAEETGIRVVTDLHLESLTDDAPAATYLDMMEHNVTLIVDALK